MSVVVVVVEPRLVGLGTWNACLGVFGYPQQASEPFQHGLRPVLDFQA
jgi:hypothetical protein